MQRSGHHPAGLSAMSWPPVHRASGTLTVQISPANLRKTSQEKAQFDCILIGFWQKRVLIRVDAHVK